MFVQYVCDKMHSHYEELVFVHYVCDKMHSHYEELVFVHYVCDKMHSHYEDLVFVAVGMNTMLVCVVSGPYHITGPRGNDRS